MVMKHMTVCGLGSGLVSHVLVAGAVVSGMGLRWNRQVVLPYQLSHGDS